MLVGVLGGGKPQRELERLQWEIAKLRRENEEQRNLLEMNRIGILRAPLAYKMITAFEMWREILEFV